MVSYMDVCHCSARLKLATCFVLLCLISVALLSGLLQLSSIKQGVWIPEAIPIQRQGWFANQRLKVIVLGYKRSGSSITAALLHSHSKVYYYIWEPLWYMKDPDRYGVPVSHSLIPLKFRIKPEFLKLSAPYEPLDLVETLLNCEMNQNIRSHIKYAGDSKDVKELDACLNASKPLDCFEKVTNRCENAKMAMVKTVRLSLVEAEQLLRADPDIKIIHVFRDPRGTQNSRLRWRDLKAAHHYVGHDRSRIRKILDRQRDPDFKNRPNETIEFFVTQCRIMREDLEKSLMITDLYKDRLLTLRYEDLADAPVLVTTKLLQFLGLDMTPEVSETIRLLMMSTDKKAYTNEYIVKKNSSAHASSWRQRVSFDVVQAVQLDCAFVFEILGYRFFRSEAELRNLSIPTREKEYDKGLHKVTL